MNQQDQNYENRYLISSNSDEQNIKTNSGAQVNSDGSLSLVVKFNKFGIFFMWKFAWFWLFLGEAVIEETTIRAAQTINLLFLTDLFDISPFFSNLSERDEY